MLMRLPNGELATNDAENDSIFGAHFHRVFNNPRPIDWPALDNINQRGVMEELDHPISGDDIKKSTTKLETSKSPGLNDVTPNSFKALNDENIN